jgi:hypothetical protein
MRKWTVGLLIVSTLLCSCVGYVGGRGWGDRGGFYHSHDWR